MKTLTLNDLAVGAFACAHAINWCKKQGRSKFWKKEVAKYEALSRKLQEISDFATPLTSDDEGSIILDDDGAVEVMRTDARVIHQLQARLKKAGAVR